MEISPLEYDLLPLPGEVTHQIILACRKDAGVSIQQLSGLRLVNKTWKAAVEAGLFGLHGRLMNSQTSTKIALLVGVPCGGDKFSVQPAIGLLDERSECVYVHPLASRNSLGFDESKSHVSLVNKTICILEGTAVRFNAPKQDQPEDSATLQLPAKSVRVHSFQSGEWKTELQGAEDADVSETSRASFMPRFCCSGGGRAFYIGQCADVSGQARETRILAYEPRRKHWTLLPRIERERVIDFCYTFGGQLYAIIADYNTPLAKEVNSRCYSYPLDWDGDLESPPCWTPRVCNRQMQELLAEQMRLMTCNKQLLNGRIDKNSLRCCKQDGLRALFLPYAPWQNKGILARERRLPGRRHERKLAFSKFKFRDQNESAKGCIPLNPLRGPGCLIMGGSSALLLRVARGQQRVRYEWGKESNKTEVVWASAFPTNQIPAELKGKGNEEEEDKLGRKRKRGRTPEPKTKTKRSKLSAS